MREISKDFQTLGTEIFISLTYGYNIKNKI